MTQTKTITVAYGDGIGPEIMEATIKILKESGANIDFNIIEVGKNIYEKGFNSGLMPSAWDDLSSTKILLKAPITTPQGSGYKSLNVTLRKKLGLFANLRPVTSFHPYVATKHPKMDVVIIRENEEDLYTGIEHRQSDQSFQCLKIVTRQGCEKIIRYAFEYCVKNNRKKLSCFSKDNIMKMTDGLFHNIFKEISKEYPQIQTDHYIIDIGTARLAAKPEIFDTIVTMNLYGDIISDVAAEISGSVGLAGSANIGQDYAMFEAIHGSAPDIAGQNIANPTGLINAAVTMLLHINQVEAANKIKNAVNKTIEDGIHTADIFNEKTSTQKVGTKEFTDAVIANLGQKPQKLAIANHQNCDSKKRDFSQSVFPQNNSKKLIGFDLFIDWKQDFNALINLLNSIESEKFEVKTISSKGLLLWPLIDEKETPKITGNIVLRFVGKNITGKNSTDIINPSKSISHHDLIEMLTICAKSNLDFIKYEGLYLFDEKAAYTATQGE